jgi:glutamate 5-kinase
MSLKNSKIIVVKIGSSLIVDNDKKIRKKWLSSFAKDIKKLKDKNQKGSNCKLRCNSAWMQENEYK